MLTGKPARHRKRLPETSTTELESAARNDVAAVPTVHGPHLIVSSPRGPDACLRCGLLSTRREPGRLRAHTCAGVVPPTARLLAPLLGGAFDADLQSALPEAVARAMQLGWVPLPAPHSEPLPWECSESATDPT